MHSGSSDVSFVGPNESMGIDLSNDIAGSGGPMSALVVGRNIATIA